MNNTKRLPTSEAVWGGNRKGQPNRSAMKEPHLERTASLITVPPASGKYAFSASPGPQNTTCLRIPCGNEGHVLLVLSCRAVHSLLCYLEKTRECEGWLLGHLFCFHLIISSPEGSGPRSEVVLYRGNPWPGRGKPLFHGPVPKISLIYELLDEQRIRY